MHLINTHLTVVSIVTAERVTMIYDEPFVLLLIIDDRMMSGACADIRILLQDLTYSLEAADEIIIYRWNSHYPADKYFDVDIQSLGYSLYSTEDFEGSSHERITEEKYRKGI